MAAMASFTIFVVLAICTRAVTTTRTCKQHHSVAACISFRHQDQCVWDVPTATCAADTPCEQRSSHRCTFELTTGKGATWDQTENRCFWDSAGDGTIAATKGRCRWTDECLTLTKGAACRAAGCAWKRYCTPQDLRFPPGPGVCSRACRPPVVPHGGRTSTRSLPDADRVPHKPVGGYAAQEAQGGHARTDGPAATPTDVVETAAGRVQGVTKDGADQYLGIPFAAAPVHTLRWAPPVPLPKWLGVFQASAYGASCAQWLGQYATDPNACKGFVRGGSTQGVQCRGYSEDCLNLNIFTPPRGRSTLKAVLVWIHGGCFVAGSSSNPAYNGAVLAATQDVVVVTVNYRVGALGFLAHDGIRYRDPAGSTGNYGLLDNIQALKWIQANIAAFGGDPARVTVFGESSGAGSVSQLLGAKAAWPYFQRGPNPIPNPNPKKQLF